jgi:hypothetical protein
MAKQRELFCSFCGKSQHAVAKLIAGPKVHICDACVDCCIEILGEDRAWCSKEIANLKRLRRQAAARPPDEASSPPVPPARGAGWLGWLWR